MLNKYHLGVYDLKDSSIHFCVPASFISQNNYTIKHEKVQLSLSFFDSLGAANSRPVILEQNHIA